MEILLQIRYFVMLNMNWSTGDPVYYTDIIMGEEVKHLVTVNARAIYSHQTLTYTNR